MNKRAYRGLEAWQKGVDMVEEVYRIIQSLPKEELFGLSGQMRRAAVSIPANIAEGYGRIHEGDYLRHLSVARGSLMELETHLIIAVRLKLVSRDAARELWKHTQEVGKLISGLIRSTQRSILNQKQSTSSHGNQL